MIYDNIEDRGKSINIVAINAIKEDCDKMLFNSRIFSLEVNIVPYKDVVDITVEPTDERDTPM